MVKRIDFISCLQKNVSITLVNLLIFESICLLYRTPHVCRSIDAEEIGKKLVVMGELLDHRVSGGDGSAYGLQYWRDLLQDVLVLDDELKGITGGLTQEIDKVIHDLLEAGRLCKECGNGLVQMSKKYKEA